MTSNLEFSTPSPDDSTDESEDQLQNPLAQKLYEQLLALGGISEKKITEEHIAYLLALGIKLEDIYNAPNPPTPSPKPTHKGNRVPSTGGKKRPRP